MSELRIVADIGGTTARFALAHLGELHRDSIKVYTCNDFVDFDALYYRYAEEQSSAQQANEVVVAVAGPVKDKSVQMTYQPWSFDEPGLRSLCKANNAKILNDFEAAAYAIPVLKANQWLAIGSPSPDPNQLMTVMGPGTGLGVALCLPVQPDFKIQSTEGGHAGISPANRLELAIFEYLLSQNQVITRELLLSGIGLTRIYQSVCAVEGVEVKEDSPEFIHRNAVERSNTQAEKALTIFCELLGSAAGDQALSTGAKGGVFIAGGMAPRFIDFLRRTQFRERFENKPPMRHYVEPIASVIVTEPYLGLVGAANVTL